MLEAREKQQWSNFNWTPPLESVLPAATPTLSLNCPRGKVGGGSTSDGSFPVWPSALNSASWGKAPAPSPTNGADGAVKVAISQEA
jgi:hypothetical protein